MERRVEHLASDPVKLEESQTGVPEAQGDDGYEDVDCKLPGVGRDR